MGKDGLAHRRLTANSRSGGCFVALIQSIPCDEDDESLSHLPFLSMYLARHSKRVFVVRQHAAG